MMIVKYREKLMKDKECILFQQKQFRQKTLNLYKIILLLIK